MRIFWLERADQQRRHALDYLGQRSPQAALDVLEHILKQIEQLKEFPEIGRRGRVRGTRELVVAHTPFVLVYRLRVQRIEILRFLHGAQQWPPEV